MAISINISSYQGNKDVLLPRCKNNLGLLRVSTMKRLKLKICSLLLIKSLNGQIVLKAWPYELLEEATIALPGVSLFKHYATSKSTIEQYTGSIFPADRVVLSPIEYKTFMDSKIFKTYLKDYLESVYLKEGTVLHVSYLGYPCCFTVKKINSNFESDAKLSQELLHERDPSVSIDYSNVNENSMLEESFSEKCCISKSLQNETRFKSSTPISSPKVPFYNKSGLENIESSALESFKDFSTSEKFYRIQKRTQFFIKNVTCDKERQSDIRFEDIGSLDEQIECIKSLVDSLLYSGSDAESKGIFVIGPQGTGKSMMAKAIQTDYKHELSVYIVNKNMMSENDSIVQLKKFFKDAQENSPSILILDNIEQLCEMDKFSHNSKNEKMLTSKISSLINNLLVTVPGILVIATSPYDSPIQSSLQKHVTLQKEIRLTVPTDIERRQIFNKILKKYDNALTPQEVLEISDMAHGFTGADLERLCEEAIDMASPRMRILFLDLKKGLDVIKPSSMGELEFDKPNVRWTDIGGMEEVKNAVKEMVDWPLKYPEQFKKLGITPSRGILMYGPPGCCKTMIAKALATESQFNFIYIKDSEVFSKYVGDSEKSVSEVFKKARGASPCILFFDEIDNIAPVRGSSNGSSNVADRVITQILIEIDGIDVLQEGVCIIAATNQPHRIDPSLLRPGRLDRLIYVPLPDAPTRKEIFKVILLEKPLSPDVDISYLVNKTEGYTGAEISGMCSQACQLLIKEDITSITSVLNMNHFLMALELTKPRTTPEMIKVFENYKKSKMHNL